MTHRAAHLGLVAIVMTATLSAAVTPVRASSSTVAGLNVFVGYAEDKETNTPNPPAFPIPWSGSANSLFLGNPVPGGQTACGAIPVCYDTGAIRLDNPTAQAVTVQDVTVDDHSSVTGGKTFDLWGSFTVPAGKSVILAANPSTNNPTFDNFDTSSFPKTCTALSVAPTVTFTIGGVATTLVDSSHVLDTGGIDVGSCTPTQNESIQWRPIGSSGVSAASLAITPSVVAAPLGQSVSESATLLDGAGTPIAHVPINLTVLCGPNIGLTISATTDGSGQTTFSYTSSTDGTDTVAAAVTTVGTFYSNQASIAWGSSPQAGWSCADIGSPTIPGSQSLSGTMWTVSGGGSDLTGSSDQFHFLWQSMVGDGSVSAHAVSQTVSSTNAKAGVMLRATTDPASPYYAVVVSPGAGIKVQLRSTQAGTTTKLANPTGTTPVYVKVTRAGSTFTAYTSPDGTAWSAIAGSTVTVAMPATLLSGLAVTAHNARGLSTVVFDSVQVGSGLPPPPPPSPPVISSVQATGITASTATISWTTSTPASSQVLYGPTTAYGTSSANDGTFVTAHSQTLRGLAASTTYHFTEISTDASNQTAAHTDATFTTATTPPPPPPSPSCPASWSCADIGAPALAGGESLTGSTWTVKAGGTDIFNYADQFHFDWQALPGDGSASVHVVSQTNTSSWAKAGVMIRMSTDPGSQYYGVFITPSNGITVQYRDLLGGRTAKLTTLAATLPAYLKVSRVGPTFSAESSADGVTWTVIPASTLTLNLITGSLLAGLAVTSHNANAISTVVMDTVAVG